MVGVDGGGKTNTQFDYDAYLAGYQIGRLDGLKNSTANSANKVDTRNNYLAKFHYESTMPVEKPIPVQLSLSFESFDVLCYLPSQYRVKFQPENVL